MEYIEYDDVYPLDNFVPELGDRRYVDYSAKILLKRLEYTVTGIVIRECVYQFEEIGVDVPYLDAELKMIEDSSGRKCLYHIYSRFTGDIHDRELLSDRIVGDVVVRFVKLKHSIRYDYTWVMADTGNNYLYKIGGEFIKWNRYFYRENMIVLERENGTRDHTDGYNKFELTMEAYEFDADDYNNRY